GVSLAAYQGMLGDAHGAQLLHFSDPAEERDEDFLERHCADDGPRPEDALHDARFRAALVSAIEHLPEREKLLMGLYYEQELNVEELAVVLGVAESRVCRLHSQAVARLRVRLRDW